LLSRWAGRKTAQIRPFGRSRQICRLVDDLERRYPPSPEYGALNATCLWRPNITDLDVH